MSKIFEIELDDQEIIKTIHREKSIYNFTEKKIKENDIYIFKNGSNSVLTKVKGQEFIKIRDFKILNSIKGENKEQKILLEYLFDDDVKCVVVTGEAGSGKAQPLDSSLLTPNGYIKMGDVKLGDKVCGEDGNFYDVTGIFPQGVKDVYNVIFDDGTSTKCCGEHLWTTQTTSEREHGKSGNVRNVLEIKDSLVSRGTRKNHSIPFVKPVNFTKQDLVLNPYLLGSLLGDGTFVNNTHFTNSEKDIVRKIEKFLPHNVKMNLVKNTDNEYSFSKINGKKHDKNDITIRLSELGLCDKKSYEKFIPKKYLLSDTNDRLELLRGLLDTDGSVHKVGNYIEYSTTSHQLSEDVKFLSQSLGARVHIAKRNTKYTYKGEKKDGRLSYRVNIQFANNIVPVSSEKHLSVYKGKPQNSVRYIKDVVCVNKEECQCIMVNNPSHLYITDECIVTHNTFCTTAFAFEAVKDGYFQEMIIARVPVSPSRKFDTGFLKGTLEEKMQPWHSVFHENIEKIKVSTGYKVNVTPREESLAFIKGKTFDNAIIIIDEAEDLTKQELKAILTRVGTNSKIIILGDVNQTTERDCGDTLPGVVKAFDDNKLSVEEQKMIATVDLKKTLRSPFVGVVLKLL